MKVAVGERGLGTFALINHALRTEENIRYAVGRSPVRSLVLLLDQSGTQKMRHDPKIAPHVPCKENRYRASGR